MATCQTCGQDIHPNTLGPEPLLQYLRENPQQYAYKGQDGGWYITRTREVRTTRGAVDTLVSRGLLHRKYSDLDEAFWTGPTIDMRATQQARQNGQRRALIYV